jgi:quercetin dioxygenase-like cupin family protein
MRRMVIWLVGLSLVGALIATGGSRTVAHDDAATPVVAAGASASWVAESLGVARLVPPGDPAQQIALTRVTLQPGGSSEPHAHHGVGVLYVDQGTICFQLDASPAPFAVKVLRQTSYPDDAGCEVPTEECWDNPEGCPLEEDQTILLNAGDTVDHVAAPSQHTYWNVGSEPAVVLIAELQTPDSGAGCSGSCR